MTRLGKQHVLLVSPQMVLIQTCALYRSRKGVFMHGSHRQRLYLEEVQLTEFNGFPTSYRWVAPSMTQGQAA